jgi:hypothetical protein
MLAELKVLPASLDQVQMLLGDCGYSSEKKPSMWLDG